MCNLYSITKGPQATRDIAGAFDSHVGNMPPLPGVFPDYPAPILRNREGKRELAMARWGMPSPLIALIALNGGRADSGVTNVRNIASPHWRRWLGVESRCVVPFTSFSEYETTAEGKKSPVWFALDESRPLAFFAGIWTTWTSVGKVKEGKITADLFAFLTCEPNAAAAPIHPEATSVILTRQDEIETWLAAEPKEALALQRPLPDDALRIVARGLRTDGEAA